MISMGTGVFRAARCPIGAATTSGTGMDSKNTRSPAANPMTPGLSSSFLADSPVFSPLMVTRP